MEITRETNINTDSLRGTVYVLLSAICFSTGGVLIKLIPWSSMTIQGIRSIFSILVVGGYMLLRRQRFVWNKTVFWGAICNTVMAFSFVAATKLTTAANAIVLQFTEPIFVILLMWFIYKKKPGKDALIACAVVFAGILCFFFESLGAGQMAGDLLAILSGFTYALVMMMKKFEGADFESSLIVSNIISAVCSGCVGFYASAWRCTVWSFLHISFERSGLCVSGYGVLNVYDRADLKPDSCCSVLRGEDRRSGGRWSSARRRSRGSL